MARARRTDLGRFLGIYLCVLTCYVFRGAAVGRRRGRHDRVTYLPTHLVCISTEKCGPAGTKVFPFEECTAIVYVCLCVGIRSL